jgi:hypothetical protein
MICPHCSKPLRDELIRSEAASLNARRAHTGGARPGAGRPPACRNCGRPDCPSCKARGIRRGPGRPRKPATEADIRATFERGHKLASQRKLR